MSDEERNHSCSYCGHEDPNGFRCKYCNSWSCHLDTGDRHLSNVVECGAHYPSQFCLECALRRFDSRRFRCSCLVCDEVILRTCVNGEWKGCEPPDCYLGCLCDNKKHMVCWPCVGKYNKDHEDRCKGLDIDVKTAVENVNVCLVSQVLAREGVTVEPEQWCEMLSDFRYDHFQYPEGVDKDWAMEKEEILRVLTEALLKSGADPDHKLSSGDSLLATLIKNSGDEVCAFPAVEVLLKAGATAKDEDLVQKAVKCKSKDSGKVLEAIMANVEGYRKSTCKKRANNKEPSPSSKKAKN